MAGGMGCLAGRDAEASKVGTAVPIQLQCADSSTVALALTPRCSDEGMARASFRGRFV